MRPESLTDLYWSIRGEVACPDHTPQPGDPRWTVEGWAPVPVASGQFYGGRYQCQHCAADGRAIIRHSIGPPN